MSKLSRLQLRYLQSLARSRALPGEPSVEQRSIVVRKEKAEGKTASECSQADSSIPHFNWEKIKEYENMKLAADADLEGSKGKLEQPRKRPNYNNTLRRLNRKLVLRLS